MKKFDFLNKLITEGKLELVEPSEEIYKSYTEKSNNCLKSAKLLLQHNLFENSVSMSYYAMYNLLIALLFKIGIKCENHSGSIIIFRNLFDRIDLYKIISFAKEERIDKQYYVTSDKNLVLTEESASDMIKMAEDFLIAMKLMISELKHSQIGNLREKFNSLLN